MTAAAANRTCHGLKAALNRAADHDESLASRRAWTIGLALIRTPAKPKRDPGRGRGAAHHCRCARYSAEFGLLVETAAATGARPSQIARIGTQDLIGEGASAKLSIPVSRKGRGVKAIPRHTVPIVAGLAVRLRAAAAGRPATAPLLLKPSGAPWRHSEHQKLFGRAVVAGEDPARVTIYALRHSSIVRQLLAGVPIRLVAVAHDTSALMIEAHLLPAYRRPWRRSDSGDAVRRRARGGGERRSAAPGRLMPVLDIAPENLGHPLTINYIISVMLWPQDEAERSRIHACRPRRALDPKCSRSDAGRKLDLLFELARRALPPRRHGDRRFRNAIVAAFWRVNCSARPFWNTRRRVSSQLERLKIDMVAPKRRKAHRAMDLGRSKLETTIWRDFKSVAPFWAAYVSFRIRRRRPRIPMPAGAPVSISGGGDFFRGEATAIQPDRRSEPLLIEKDLWVLPPGLPIEPAELEFGDRCKPFCNSQL